MASGDAGLDRYSRQILIPEIGERGQRQLVHSHVTLIGCGALGSVIATTLVRAGLGSLRIVDRDFIELNNLQRQVLFDEQDVAAHTPKAEAAARKLRRINSGCEVEAVIADFNHTNAEPLCEHADLLLDGTDNFETRYLLNDVAVKLDIPWIYGACIAKEGLVCSIRPGQTPCLRCMWPDPPPPGESPTCDTAGILGPVVNIVASMQSMEAIKLLTSNTAALIRGMIAVDAWTGRVRTLDMQSAHDPDGCICCGRRGFEFLSGARASGATALCGRNAVQVLPSGGGEVLSLPRLAERLRAQRVAHNEFMLRFTADGCDFTVFPDGRAILKGVDDPAKARTLYAKYVGH